MMKSTLDMTQIIFETPIGSIKNHNISVVHKVRIIVSQSEPH